MVNLSKDLKFIPLYISNEVLSITKKFVHERNKKFFYRCDLHNFTQKEKLSDTQSADFPYKTIHTVKTTRYARFKQDIYDKWNIIIPLSTYYVPYIAHNANVTQSVGYISFETKHEAELYLLKITAPVYKLLVHLTRYGNFNNIMVLKHLDFDSDFVLTDSEKKVVEKLSTLIKY